MRKHINAEELIVRGKKKCDEDLLEFETMQLSNSKFLILGINKMIIIQRK